MDNTTDNQIKLGQLWDLNNPEWDTLAANADAANESARCALGRGHLTTESSQSSYGIPVWILDGTAYAASDLMPGSDLVRKSWPTVRDFVTHRDDDGFIGDLAKTLLPAFLGERP